MEILQLPLLALQERIEAELVSNPVLEMRLPEAQENPAPAPPDEPPRGESMMTVGQRGEDFARVSDFYEEFGPELAHDAAPAAQAPAAGQRDRKLDAMANAPAPDASLADYLLGQWAFLDVAAPLDAAGRAIIAYLDDDGYLRTSLEEIVAQAQPPLKVEDLLSALKVVQSLDPPGIAARDLQECLWLQLASKQAAGENVELELELVRNHLRDIEANRLPQIARRTGKTLEQVQQAIARLGKLSPAPGSLVRGGSAPAILPDAVVSIDQQGQLVVTMPRQYSPRLSISREYSKLARNRSTEPDARRFLRDNIRSAQWLIGALEQRRQTVQRVCEEVFAVQREFLLRGPEALRPLPMADIAQKVGVHVATVSRAVSGKYVQTPRGILPLRMFFSGGTKTEGGEDVAWDAVRARLREIVDGEDKLHPLNDDAIAAELARHGLHIARRTVAKYRDIMEIPPARKRRRFAPPATGAAPR